MRKQKGFGLIGILLVIGALSITAGGVVVWQRKILPIPMPIPIPLPSNETQRIPPEDASNIEDVSQFCGLEGLKKLSLTDRGFPVIWIYKCGPLYRLLRECCDAPDIILDENFNFVAECGGFAAYSDECTKLVSPYFNKCVKVATCER